MAGGKKSKRDGDRKSKKRGREHTPAASVEPSDEEDNYDQSSTGEDFVPAAAKLDMEAKVDQNTIEDEYGAKDFRSQMNLRPDHEVKIFDIFVKKWQFSSIFQIVIFLYFRVDHCG
jgi:DNA excision repair protein ERCC-3